MNKPHKWAKEIKAWADGAKVQYKDGRDWLDVDEPVWNAKSAEYRIKLQPKEPKYLYVYQMGEKMELAPIKRDTLKFICHGQEIPFSYTGKIRLETEDV